MSQSAKKSSAWNEILRTGDAGGKLAVLEELFEIASRCREKTDSLHRSVLAEPSMREHYRPWREFLAIAGEPVFEALVEIVRDTNPSEVRARAGDIMARVWHPSAIGRLLEAFEERREKKSDLPAAGIFRDLGGIGTEAAARAIMWLWGSGFDAEAAGALGRCESEVAQDFLLRNAREHSNSYVRSVCISGIKPPLTEEKTALLINRLETGTQNEQIFAAMRVQDLRMIRALPVLLALRAGNADMVLLRIIDETLAALGAGRPAALRSR